MKEFFVELIMWQVAEPGPGLVLRLLDAASKYGLALRFRNAPIAPDAVRQALDERVEENAAARTPDGTTPFGISFTATLSPHNDVQTSFSFQISSSSPPKPYWSQFRIGGLLDFEFKDQRRLIAPYADRMLELAQVLYPIARPQLGYIDNSHYTANEPRDVKKLRLNALGWATFFSPAYAERYGEDFLLGLPGYRNQRLPDGGVFFQLAPAIIAADKAEAQALRARVAAYCAEHGHTISCHAPYIIRGATLAPPTADDPAADVRALLQTTFVLDDGVRLKTLLLPWDELSAQQRASVVAALRDELEHALRAQDGPLRLELNIVPPEVEQALRELAGRAKADFSWTQVAL